MKKEDSVALRGIAVMMMLLLHFFLDITDYPKNLFINPWFFQRFVWTGRMCVAIFSFVSGYGMYQVLRKKEALCEMVKDCTKRLLQLYARVLLVILLCVYLPRFLLGEEILLSQLPGNLFGYNTVYNGAWWFVLEYMWFMLLAPILAMIVNSRVKKGIRILIVAVLVLLGMYGKGLIFANPTAIEFFERRMQPVFLVIFTEGFIAGKMQEFVAGMKWPEKGREIVEKLRHPLVGSVICLAAFVLRYLYSVDPNRANADVLLAPMFCCGACLSFKCVPYVKKILVILGENSIYLWFVHNLIYDRLYSFLIKRSGYWLVFYLVMLAIGLVLSIILKKIEKWVKEIGYKVIVSANLTT